MNKLTLLCGNFTFLENPHICIINELESVFKWTKETVDNEIDKIENEFISWVIVEEYNGDIIFK